MSTISGRQWTACSGEPRGPGSLRCCLLEACFARTAMKAQFWLPSRPAFPNDLKVLLLESSADQPAVAEQLQNLSYTGGPTTCISDTQRHSMRLDPIQSATRAPRRHSPRRTTPLLVPRHLPMAVASMNVVHRCRPSSIHVLLESCCTWDAARGS